LLPAENAEPNHSLCTKKLYYPLCCCWTVLSEDAGSNIYNYDRLLGTVVYRCHQIFWHFWKMDVKWYSYMEMIYTKILKGFLR